MHHVVNRTALRGEGTHGHAPCANTLTHVCHTVLTSRGVRCAAHKYCHSSVAFMVGHVAALHTGSSTVVRAFRSVTNCLQAQHGGMSGEGEVGGGRRGTSPNVFKHPHGRLHAGGQRAERVGIRARLCKRPHHTHCRGRGGRGGREGDAALVPSSPSKYCSTSCAARGPKSPGGSASPCRVNVAASRGVPGCRMRRRGGVGLDMG